MPEFVNNRNVFSLSEYIGSISKAVDKFYSHRYWIKAEISKLNFFERSGHCYPELVETRDGHSIASISAFIHKRDYQRINGRFLEMIGDPLKDGMQVLVLVKAHLSLTRGLKLLISDIDIESVLGSQAMAVIGCVNRLKADGVFTLNRRLSLPRIVRRLAVVSVVSGKGFADFRSIVDNSPFVKISYTLLNANMTGNQAVAEISSCLNAIVGRIREFDAVCIIRGGGGENTLQCFNTYELASQVARFPLPVLTGIGHATNQTVVEQVSCRSFVTSSELANFLVDRNSAEARLLDSTVEHIFSVISSRSKFASQKFGFEAANLRMAFRYALKEKSVSLDSSFKNISEKLDRRFLVTGHNIDSLVDKVRNRFANVLALNGSRISVLETEMLRRMWKQDRIFAGGKPLRSVSDVEVGETIKFYTDDGIVVSEVKEIVRN